MSQNKIACARDKLASVTLQRKQSYNYRKRIYLLQNGKQNMFKNTCLTYVIKNIFIYFSKVRQATQTGATIYHIQAKLICNYALSFLIDKKIHLSGVLCSISIM